MYCYNNMRVDNVNQSKKIGYIKFNSDAEIDLISESMDRLIAKQKKLADRVGDRDHEELERLERFKKSKDAVVEIPKQNRIRMRAMREGIKTQKINEMLAKNPNLNIQDKNNMRIDLEETEEFRNAAKVISESEPGSGLGEGTEVTHRNMHVLANALNDHIWEMEKDGAYKKTRRNKNKYDELVKLLEQVQEQKAHFERVTPKPRGWGRLRK